MGKVFNYVPLNSPTRKKLTYPAPPDGVVSDSNVQAQWALIKANGVGTLGTLVGVSAREGVECNPGIVDAEGNLTDSLNVIDFFGNAAPPASLAVRSLVIGAPVAGSTTALNTAVTLTGATQTIVCTNPTDVARQVTLTGSQAGLVGTAVVSGRGIRGLAITENVTMNGTATIACANACLGQVTVVMPAKTNGSGDTISVGTNSTFGLYDVLDHNSLIAHFSSATKYESGETLVTSGAAVAANLFTPNGGATINGATQLRVDYYHQ